MRHSILTTLAATALLYLPANAVAQTAADPSGHWQGALVLPNSELPFEVDLGNINGKLAGTISVPSQQLRDMPLGSVKVEGQTVTFIVGGNGGGTFTGQLAGATLEGDFAGQQGSITFSLKRTGDAKLAGPPRGSRLADGMEGTWLAKLEANGRTMRLQITMSNDADGKSVGHAISLDEGNLDLPIAITDGSTSAFTFNVPATGSMFTGTLNAAKTEIAGTYEQRGLRLPLKFVRTLAQ